MAFVNNFYGKAEHVQIQQGGKENTMISNGSVVVDDYDKVICLLKEIKRCEPLFDETYGEKASYVREKLDEIESLVVNHDSKGCIGKLFEDIKNVSLGVTGNVIASGIAHLIGV